MSFRASLTRLVPVAVLLLCLAAVIGCRSSGTSEPPFAGLELGQGAEPATSRVLLGLSQLEAMAPEQGEQGWSCLSLDGYLLPANQPNRSYISVAKRYGVWPLGEDGRIACQEKQRRLVSPPIPPGPYYLVVLHGERCPKPRYRDAYIEGEAYVIEIQVPKNVEFEIEATAKARTFEVRCGW